MGDHEIFDKAVRGRGLGQRASFSADHPGASGYQYIRTFSETLIASAREHVDRPLPPIHLDFVVNGNVDAMAFKACDRYFIGVNTGTVFMLELLFMRMLSDSRLFPDIGDPSAESANLAPLAYYIPKAEEMHKAGHRSAPPKTPARHQYAVTLLEQALLFLVGHEIAHITLGHVDYFNAKKGVTLLSELGVNDLSQDDRIERQCLEAQADMRSVVSRIGSIKETHEAQDGATPLWSDAPLSISHLFFLWAVAMNTLFRLFGDPKFDPAHLANEFYPPLPLRRAMATATVCGVVMHWDSALKEKAELSFRTAIKYTEYAFAVILDEEVNLTNLNDAFSPLGKEYYKRLISRISELQKKLNPYCYERTV